MHVFSASKTLRNSAYSSLLLLLWFVLAIAPHLQAQTLSLFNVSPTNFPQVRGQFYAIDSLGRLVTAVGLQNTTMFENGTERRIISISCPTPPPPRPLSAILTLDVSGSMSAARDGRTRNIDIMQGAAKAFVNALTLGTPSPMLPGGSECAVTSFDHENYLNQDWTTDRPRLIRAIDSLRPQGGTDYDAGFLTRPAGGIEIAKTGKHRRILIFFTDGIGSGNETDIIRAARAQDVRVYAVCLGLPAPLLLRNVAQATGGLVLDNISTVEQARQAFFTILYAAQDTPPCDIVWQSAPPTFNCGTSGVVLRTVEMVVEGGAFGLPKAQAVIGSGGYGLPAPAQPQLVVSPPSVGFNLTGAQLGTPQTRTMTITARNGDYRIFNIVSSDTNFRVSPTQFSLANGTSQTLTVTYTPREAGFALGVFLVVADTCPTAFYAVSRTTVPPVRPTLVLTFPNGGQRFLAGTDSIVTWRGVAPDDSVRLEYSIDSGRTWNLLVERAGGLQYNWRQIPNMPSERCLMRVTQLVASPDPDTVITVPAAASFARFVSGGERVAAGFNGQVTFWDSFNSAFYGGQARHRSAIRDMAVSPDGLRLATADDAGTIVIWNNDRAQLASAIIGNVGNAVRYSPDGTLLATAGGTEPNNPGIGLLQFYNAETTELLREVRYSTVGGRPRELFFTPDGRTIGMVRSDGGLFFWNVQTGAIVQPPLGSSRDVNSAIFSPDGRELALAKRNGCERWDWQRGLLIRRFAAGQNVVSVRFSPNGRRIITAALTNGVSIWDAGGVNALIRSFVLPSQEATYAEYHPDSRRFLTVSNQVARVYALAEPIALQSDVSDSLWAIVAPDAVGRDIDMRTSLVGVPKDSVIQAFIRNTGTFPVRLDSIYFTGDNPEDFELVTGVPALIPVGASATVEFRFRPRAAGERTARINVVMQHTTLQYTIRGIGLTPTLQIIGSIIDFGSVLVGSRRDSVVTAVLRNTGTTPIGVTATQLGGPDNVQFVIVSGTPMFTLAPGEARQITLRFAPMAVGRANGSVVFTYGNGLQATVRLLGNGVLMLPVPPCTLRLNDTAARPNDRLCVSLLQSCSGQPEFSTSVTVLVSFNASLLIPEAPTPLGVVAGGIRYIPITLNLRPVSSTASTRQLDVSPLENMCFGVMLGNTSSTRINVEVVSPPGAFLNTSAANFRLITSQAGGTHLFFSTSASLRILTTQPNPANEQVTIRYSTPTTGTLTLTLVDVFGRTLRTQAIMPRAAGQNEATLLVSDVPNGVYFVRLTSARETAAQRILIAR
ncbi:MAG: choice-of-anchor D domain-containing protein [Candidatus Kapabacteria bacterium]|jgi:WD40 repeat protein|nr:choice-of-anchor D domain-containing protein [Candidatus Kapabacteria bacterium]